MPLSCRRSLFRVTPFCPIREGAYPADMQACAHAEKPNRSGIQWEPFRVVSVTSSYAMGLLGRRVSDRLPTGRLDLPQLVAIKKRMESATHFLHRIVWQVPTFSPVPLVASGSLITRASVRRTGVVE